MKIGKKTILSLLGVATLLLVAGTWCVPFIGIRESIPFESLSVWPDGTPRLGPFEIRLAGTNDTLVLAHRLAFDGERYRSELYMPILDSLVLQRDNGLYEWRDMDGRWFSLRDTPPDKNNAWSFEMIGRNKILITCADNDERHVYSDGKLAEAFHNGVQWMFAYKDGQLRRILKGQPGMQIFLELDYDQNGRIKAISNTQGDSVTVSRNADGMPTGIKDAHGADMIFAYTDGLLTHATCGGKTFDWKWGAARRTHNLPKFPLPPMISSDGINNYKVLYDGNIIKVNFSPKGGGRGKSWDYLPLTGGILARPF